MGHATDTRSIVKARKNHYCSWCAEAIYTGQPYDTWRWYDGGDASTVKVHPECLEALDEVIKKEGGDYEFFAGDNPRGCSCGFSKGCKTCEDNAVNPHNK